VLFYALTTETGTPFSGRIEVEDDHVFDIKLLTFSRISAKVNDWDLCEIIEYIMYDDEDVDNDYYSTSGKDFVIEIFDE
jgi:tagatose-1,6-bisphosphate aldolase